MGDTEEIGPPVRKRLRVMLRYCSEYVVQYPVISVILMLIALGVKWT